MIAFSLMLSSVNAFSQIKNSQSLTVKVSGNCEMCKSTIEKAGNVNNEAKVVWNQDSKTATLTYDSKKTSPDKILKRIADAGYDNEKYIASDKAYNQLPGCCHYERTLKSSKNKSLKK